MLAAKFTTDLIKKFTDDEAYYSWRISTFNDKWFFSIYTSEFNIKRSYSNAYPTIPLYFARSDLISHSFPRASFLYRVFNCI